MEIGRVFTVFYDDIYGYIKIYPKKPKHIYIEVYITVSWDGNMPLTRKARIVGSSLVITIPSQLAIANDIKPGDELEIIPEGLGEFKIRKIKHPKRKT